LGKNVVGARGGEGSLSVAGSPRRIAQKEWIGVGLVDGGRKGSSRWVWGGVSHGREAGVRIGWENWDWLGALDLEGKMSGGMGVKKTRPTTPEGGRQTKGLLVGRVARQQNGLAGRCADGNPKEYPHNVIRRTMWGNPLPTAAPKSAVREREKLDAGTPSGPENTDPYPPPPPPPLPAIS